MMGNEKPVGTDYFDFNVVDADLRTLQTAYEDFYKAMQRIDVKINTMINIPDNGALYGIKGKSFLDTWNDKCAGFKNYYYLFKQWSGKVIEISNIYADFEKSVYGESAKKIEFKKIEETIEKSSIVEARLLTALLLGVDEIDGVVINNRTEGGQEYAQLLGDATYLIKRDEAGNIISVTNASDGTVFDVENNKTVEERITDKYNSYKNGEMSEEKWQTYLSGLDEEGQRYVMYLETGASLYSDAEIESILKDYVSSSVDLTGVGNLYVFNNDIVISRDGVPYEFMGLSNVDLGGYVSENPQAIFRALNSVSGKEELYTYENGEFKRFEGDYDTYQSPYVTTYPSAISFEDGSGPVRVIESNTERDPLKVGAIYTTHYYGVPDANDPSIVTITSTEDLRSLNPEENGNNWYSLPKVIYIPEGHYIHDDRGGGVWDAIWGFNVKTADNKGFYMVRDDESFSYWILWENGVYYEFGANEYRLGNDSLSNNYLSFK